VEDVKSQYNKAKKSAKRAVASAMKEASERLIKEIENDKSSKIMFKTTKQSVKENKNVLGNGCVRDRSGKLCIGERERAKVWKEHMEKVMNEENEWDGAVELTSYMGQ
jgi:prenyltransferase beta subunit